MGPMYARFAILMHESAHKLLFTNKRWNDCIGKWVVAYPVFTPVQLYRRVHFAHHKDEFGPDEPDIAFYAPYPCTRRALCRRLFRDAVGISGWKNFVPLVKNTVRKGRSAPSGCRSSACRPSCGRSCGPPPGAGGSTPCCGSSPG